MARKRAAPEVIKAADDSADDGIVVTSTGVRFRCKAAPALMLNRAVNLHPRPEVPMIQVDGKRAAEPNPDDPKFRAAMEEWIQAIAHHYNDIMLMFGTEVLVIPEGIPGPDDDSWIERFDALGIPITREGPIRYLDWVKGVAAPAENDILLLMAQVGIRTGTNESEVEAMMASFRRAPVRGAAGDSEDAPPD